MAVTVIFLLILFYSSPESSSASSDPRENAEQQTILQQTHAGVISTSHCNTMSNSTLKSSVLSKAAKSPSEEYSMPKSVVQSNVNPQCYKQRLSPYQHAGEDTLDISFSENEPGPSMSDVRSKVSWV